jgi:hypothetical protein
MSANGGKRTLRTINYSGAALLVGVDAVKTATAMFVMVALGGCAGWEPQTTGPIALTRACPLKRAPEVSDYGEAGVQGVYHFVIAGASKSDLAGFLGASQKEGYSVMLMTVNLNGKDTLFATGPRPLHSQLDVDQAFGVACGLGRGKVFLTHVRYNSVAAEPGFIRAR